MEEELFNNKIDDGESLVVSCDNCGGDMYYEASLSKLVCEYCGSQKEVSTEKLANRKHSYNDFVSVDRATTNEFYTLTCNSCGAISIVNNNEVTSICRFCGDKLVTTKGEKHRSIKIDGIIPFRINLKTAEAIFIKHIKKKFFVPRKLKKLDLRHNQYDVANSELFFCTTLTGVYLPHWIFDYSCSSSYQAMKGRRVYQTRTIRGNDGRHRTITESRIIYRRVNGTYHHQFSNIMQRASKFEIGRRAERYDLNSLETYDEKLMVGFSALLYDIGLKDSFIEATKTMYPEVKIGILKQVGGEQSYLVKSSEEYFNIGFHNCLVPLWLVNMKYHKKNYKLYINGQSGTIKGSIPVSKVKILILIGLAVVLIASAIIVIMTISGNGGSFELK